MPTGTTASRHLKRPSLIEPTQRSIESSDACKRAAFAEYSDRGVRLANSMLRSLADAEESVQEAFCRLLTSRHKLEVSDQFAAVFFTTVRNLCIDRLRRRKSRPTVSLDNASLENASLENGTFANADTHQSARELNRLRETTRLLIEELPGSWKDALRLKTDAELRYDEIAIVLDCTKSQVRTWIFRARRQLERELTKCGFEITKRTNVEAKEQS